MIYDCEIHLHVTAVVAQIYSNIQEEFSIKNSADKREGPGFESRLRNFFCVWIFFRRQEWLFFYLNTEDTIFEWVDHFFLYFESLKLSFPLILEVWDRKGRRLRLS